MWQSLLSSAVLMGLAGSAHCLAMCGAACTALAGRAPAGAAAVPGPSAWAPLLAFHLARALSYAVAGAVVATGVGALSTLGQAVGVLRPLWTLVHLAALVLGVWLLWQGRQPAWMERLGRVRPDASAAGPAPLTVALPLPGRTAADGAAARRIDLRRLRRATAAGLLWAAWPCGLLQSALLVAALASRPWQGAAVMAGFAAGSAAGLLFGPWLWWRLTGLRADARRAERWSVLSVRLAGLALAAASAWALGHGLWLRVAAWCGL